MARVGPDGTHGMAYGAGNGRSGVHQEGRSWTFARVGELDRRGRGFFEGGVYVTPGPFVSAQ